MRRHFYPSSGDRTSFKPCAGGDAWDPACFSQQMALTRGAIPSDKEFLLTEYNAGCCMQYYQHDNSGACLLYTSPSPRDATLSRMPSSA